MMLGLAGVWTDGIVDRWASERDGTIVWTADRHSENFCLESSAEYSDITLNSGIPCKTTSLQTSDFVQTQNEANITNTLIVGKLLKLVGLSQRIQILSLLLKKKRMTYQ
jgi:hypothetical protein